MTLLATLLFFRGTHVGFAGVMRTWLPSAMLCALAIVLGTTLS